MTIIQLESAPTYRDPLHDSDLCDRLETLARER